ncbi:MAG: endonuclease/exonuclease/phosphatase family protein [Chloroflexota bacterium]|nr:endonuclease/exonuclease/phosphatase family protein [Chloroflexota bacterium]
MIKIVSWNIAKRHDPWRELLRMDVDVALLQEASPPPDDVVALRDGVLPPAEEPVILDIGPKDAWDSHSWNSDWWHGRWPALFDRWPMVVRLSDRVNVEWFKQVGPVGWVDKDDEIAVSGIGTITAARVTPTDGSAEPFIVVSMYGRWEAPHPSKNKSSWIYSDASVHRIISDLSAFIASKDPTTHRILAAGDLNMAYGSLENNPLALPARERSVWTRMEALGMEFLGPQYPAGRQAWPTPYGLPADTRNVPTYRTNRQTPATAQNQLDYVFASRGFHESITARALNNSDEWGPSDHCRVLIEVAEG